MSEKVPELIIHPDDFSLYLKTRYIGKSVAEVAEILGVSEKLTYTLMTGKRPPSKAILKKLDGGLYYGFWKPSPAKKEKP